MVCKCNCKCEFFNDIDLFGKKAELYYRGKSKKTTWIGRIFTIFYVLLYCAFFIYKVVRMAKKEDVTFYDTYAFTGEPPNIQLTKDKFYGGFALGNPLTLETFVDDTIYNVKAYYYSGTKESGTWDFKVTPLDIETCKLEGFGENYRDIFKEKHIEELHCIPVLDQLLRGHLTYDVYSYFLVRFFPCINSTENNFSCKPLPVIQKYLTQTFVRFKMEDVDLTPQIYDSPVQLRGKEVSANIWANLFQDIHSFFQIVNIETDEDFLGFEFFSRTKKEKYIKYDESIILSSLKGNIFETGGSICDITIQLSEQELTQIRTYPKLIVVLGDVGGLMEVFFSFFNVIASFLTDTFYDQSLVNHLFEFDIDKKTILLKKPKLKKNKNAFQNNQPKIYDVKKVSKSSKRNSVFINNISNQTKGKLNEDPLFKSKNTNDSILIAIPKKRKSKVKLKTTIIKNSSKRTNFLEEEEKGEMTEDFLSDIVKNPCPISKTKVIDIISKFIQKSKLIEKLESDFQSDKKIASNSLSQMCAEKLNYIELNSGDIVFKIGDVGDRFYFILSGNISILKLKEIPHVEMTYIQYIKYCIFLLNSNEEYLLNEVIKANHSMLNLSSQEDIKTIYKIIFMRKLAENINKTILNNNLLKVFFKQNGQNFEDYDIKEEEIGLLEQQKLKGIQGAGKEWENYITKRIKLTVSEQVFFQPFEIILTDNKPKKICCFCYHSFLYLLKNIFYALCII